MTRIMFMDSCVMCGRELTGRQSAFCCAFCRGRNYRKKKEIKNCCQHPGCFREVDNGSFCNKCRVLRERYFSEDTQIDLEENEEYYRKKRRRERRNGK